MGLLFSKITSTNKNSTLTRCRANKLNVRGWRPWILTILHPLTMLNDGDSLLPFTAIKRASLWQQHVNTPVFRRIKTVSSSWRVPTFITCLNNAFKSRCEINISPALLLEIHKLNINILLQANSITPFKWHSAEPEQRRGHVRHTVHAVHANVCLNKRNEPSLNLTLIRAGKTFKQKKLSVMI